jgi:hypothetical protein
LVQLDADVAPLVHAMPPAYDPAPLRGPPTQLTADPVAVKPSLHCTSHAVPAGTDSAAQLVALTLAGGENAAQSEPQPGILIEPAGIVIRRLSIDGELPNAPLSASKFVEVEGRAQASVPDPVA